MKLINIGFGNIVSANRLVAIVGPESAPIKRIIQDARDRGFLVDATYGRRTRAVLIADSGHVILSAVQPETVANRLTVKDSDEETAEVFFSVSATTRKMRENDREGVTYFFKTKEEFEQMVAENALLEWATFCDNSYGTPKAPVLERLKKGVSVLLEIDVQGALQVKKNYPEAVLVFILPPSLSTLENRLRSRGTETEEAIRTRVQQYRREFEQATAYE